MTKRKVDHSASVISPAGCQNWTEGTVRIADVRTAMWAPLMAARRSPWCRDLLQKTSPKQEAKVVGVARLTV